MTEIICSKSDVFAAPLPSCLRPAVERLTLEVSRGKSKGQTATVNVCASCANMLTLHSGLRVTERGDVT